MVYTQEGTISKQTHGRMSVAGMLAQCTRAEQGARELGSREGAALHGTGRAPGACRASGGSNNAGGLRSYSVVDLLQRVFSRMLIKSRGTLGGCEVQASGECGRPRARHKAEAAAKRGASDRIEVHWIEKRASTATSGYRWEVGWGEAGACVCVAWVCPR